MKNEAIEKLIESKIDELAIIVARGFERVDQQFAETRQEMNDRFDTLDAKVSRLSNRVERLEDDMRVVKTRLKIVPA